MCLCGDFAGARDKFGHCLKVHTPIVSVCVSVVTSLGPGTSLAIASRYMLFQGWGCGGGSVSVCLCGDFVLCVSVATSLGPGTSLPIVSRYMLCWCVCVCVSLSVSVCLW